MENSKTIRTTKTKQILDHLKSGKSITSLQAIDLYGATRLSAIIFKLRDRGYDIKTTMVQALDRNQNTVNFAVYRLVELETNLTPQQQQEEDEEANTFFGRIWKKIGLTEN